MNSPYLPPLKHWELDEDNRPTNRVIETRRSSELLTALPGASATSARSHTRSLFENVGLSTEATEFNPSPIINELRQELDTWRRLPNPSQWKVTPTTQGLLQHWRSLQTDDTQSIRPFFCQIEAVEADVAPNFYPA